MTAIVGTHGLTRAIRRWIEAGEVAEALAGLEALGLALLAAGLPSVGPRELAAELAEPSALEGLARRAERATTTDAWQAASIRRGLAWLDLPRKAPGRSPHGLAGEPGGLRLLPAAIGAPRKPVAEETVLRLLRGELDGFRAAEVARELVQTDAGRRELGWLVGSRRAAPLLRLAADGSSPLRDPAEGTVVARKTSGRGAARLALEVVRFEDGVLAVYASRPLPLALAAGASGHRAVAQAPGYLELEEITPGAELALRAGGIDIVVVRRKKRGRRDE